MISLKLSVEEYNRLYYMLNYGYFLCKRLEDNIVFVKPKNESVILNVNLHTKVGRILSHYTECLLYCTIREDRSISVHNVCMGTYANCKNCIVGDCKKGISKKLRRLKNKIEDIQFIDPISNRNKTTVNKIEDWAYEIQMRKDDFSSNHDEEIQKICKTTDVLINQLKELFDKWRYDNYG